MTNTPETDVRTALNEAATVTGLGFDEAAVLSRGHRVVRRRRIATAGAGIAAVALGTVVALQVSGNGFNRALPPATSPTSTVVAVAGTVDEAGEVVPGTDEAGASQGYGARLSVKGGTGGRVVETWTVTESGTTVKSLTREAGLLAVGQASLLLPAESGLPGLVLGYVNTGSDRSVSVGINTAPEQLIGGGGSATHLAAVGGAARRHDHLFVQKYDAFDPSKIVGLSWAEANDPDPTKLQKRSILLNTDRRDLDAVVLSQPDGNQWISWASDTEIGVASSNGNSRPEAVTGALRLLALPAVDNPAVGEPDKIFGWVTGNESTTVTVRTTASDSVVTSYGPVRSGRRPFLITSKQGLLRSPVTVTGAGITQTIDLETLRNIPQ
ncbi:hypothetical protein BA895_13300 [Humibacillus sp. DSM 29435]|uniref:hypothetical protein n=1 Tax=Humibacillus sp. DSM 29435 TaxID=1869167 RepID=UPI000872BDF8|nr:hypothetical protein [Humibacillus sp. DSM 29435]OFE18091.1 hypothetical protein BA895_13300 [Humibacillus sp. DSM 29435]